MEELDNYQEEKLTIDLVWANVFGILILIPIALIFGLPYYLIWKGQLHSESLKEVLSLDSVATMPMVILVMIMGIVLHELIHGLIWARFASKGFKSIKFGVLWKMLTPYCHCKEPLKVKHYILGAIGPGIILGVIPALIAIATGNIAFLIFGIFFTMAAAGDILVVNLIRKEHPDELVQDHPSEAGFFIYRRKKDD